MKGNRTSTACMARNEGNVVPLLRKPAVPVHSDPVLVTIDARMLFVMKGSLNRATETLNALFVLAGVDPDRGGC